MRNLSMLSLIFFFHLYICSQTNFLKLKVSHMISQNSVALNKCPYFLQRLRCMGGSKGKCGLNHRAPYRYCSLINKGEACSGASDGVCGIPHPPCSKSAIICLNGMRFGK